jgi:hypothetical protein
MAQGGVITQRPYSPAAAGWALFAGTMMIILGFIGAFQGLAAIFGNDFFIVGREYVYSFSTTAWGWWHLLLGMLIVAAGIGVFSGKKWARGVGIALASISAISNFLFIPYYPFWAMLIIALDIGVIWGLARYSPPADDLDPDMVPE